MAPAESLARSRKHVLDRVSRGEVTVARACRDAGISALGRCRLEEAFREGLPQPRARATTAWPRGLTGSRPPTPESRGMKRPVRAM